MAGQIHLTNLPFAVSMRLRLDTSRINGQTAFDFLPAGASDVDLEGSLEMIDLFESIVNRGFFRSGQLKPISASNLEYTKTFFVTDLPVSALCVLFALLAQTKYAGDSLQGVRVALEDVRNENLQFLVQSPLDVLAGPGATPFDVYFDDNIEVGQPLDICIEFQESVSPDEVAFVEESLGHWGIVVALGGGDFDFGEQPEFVPDFGNTSHVEPNVLTHSFDYFCGPKEMCNLLVNFVCRIHEQGSKVSMLRISG